MTSISLSGTVGRSKYYRLGHTVRILESALPLVSVLWITENKPWPSPPVPRHTAPHCLDLFSVLWPGDISRMRIWCCAPSLAAAPPCLQDEIQTPRPACRDPGPHFCHSYSFFYCPATLNIRCSSQLCLHDSLCRNTLPFLTWLSYWSSLKTVCPSFQLSAVVKHTWHEACLCKHCKCELREP